MSEHLNKRRKMNHDIDQYQIQSGPICVNRKYLKSVINALNTNHKLKLLFRYSILLSTNIGYIKFKNYDIDAMTHKYTYNLHLRYGSNDVIDEVEQINDNISKYFFDYNDKSTIRNVMHKIFEQDQICINQDTPIFYKPIDCNDNCMICCNVLKRNITRLDCGHYMHTNCYNNFQQSLSNNFKVSDVTIKCPLCNKIIDTTDNLIFNKASNTTKINSDIIQYHQYVMDIRDLMISVENYQRFVIEVKMYQEWFTIPSNIIKLEIVDRSRIEETEENQYSKISEMFNHILHIDDEADDWYDIWSNFVSSSINPILYKLLISIYKESNQFDLKLYQTIDYMMLKYTIFNNQFDNWYKWSQLNIPDAPLLSPNPDNLVNKCLKQIGPSDYLNNIDWDNWCKLMHSMINLNQEQMK